jgi:uncharacterized protein
MNKYFGILVALMVTLFTFGASAYTPPPAPANGWYVVDQAGKLSDSQMKLLNQKIDRVSKATKNEFGILLLQDMGGDNIEDVANATFKAWGVGKKGLDNGCLIVVAIKERKSRIETGKGVGGEITDLQANDIIRKNLNPHLKAGDFYGAFDDTLNAISGLMESRMNQKAEPKPVQAVPVAAVPAADIPANTNSSGSGFGLGLFLVLGAAGLIIAFLVMAANARSRREEEARLREEEEADRQRRAQERAELNARQKKLDDAQRSYDPFPSRGTIYSDPPAPVAKPVTYVKQQPLNPAYIKPTVVASAAAVAVAATAVEEARRARKLEAERQLPTTLVVGLLLNHF